MLTVLLFLIWVFMDPGHGFRGYFALGIGCVLAVLLNNETWYSKLRVLTQEMGPLFIVGLFIAVHLLKLECPSFKYVYALSVAPIILLVVIGNGPLTKMLELPVLKFIGSISYGIYLIHILASNAIQLLASQSSGLLLNTALTFVCTVVLTIFLASLMYFLFEKPLVNFGRKLANDAR